MSCYYLAIDIGASSGRHILGRLHNGRLEIEEIYRFKNGFTKKNGHLCWDTDYLMGEIITGMARCKEKNKVPISVGIDTWGVDFVLLGENGKKIGDAVSYRDSRTDGMDVTLREYIGEPELYARTGIQKLPFNTIYQLLALQRQQPELLEQAYRLLMIPEYISYLLTGQQAHEYTNASTTGLIHAQNKTWDYELIERAGLPKRLFGEIVAPGASIGGILPEIAEKVGFNCNVVLPCTHDTGSAVVSAPIDENSLYLSSGTWSLMGVELAAPVCTEESRLSNLTNEGGYDYRYRYLKNIMGLWIIQNIKAEYGGEYSFGDLSGEAKQSGGFSSRIDINDNRFLAPGNMTEEIKAACRDSGQQAPETIGELMVCVYQSLVADYAKTVKEIETLTNKYYDQICIVGGGSQDQYLNELTAKACGKRVSAGPVEGTAIGNILVQMICDKKLSDISEARDIVRQSFPIIEY